MSRWHRPLVPSACTPEVAGADKAATDDDGFKATADNTPIVGGKGDTSDPYEFTDDDPLAGPLRMLSSPHPNVTERKRTPGSKRGKARITPLSAKKDDGPHAGSAEKGQGRKHQVRRHVLVTRCLPPRVSAAGRGEELIRLGAGGSDRPRGDDRGRR